MSDQTIGRRWLLRGLVAAGATLAGCAGTDPTPTPTDPPEEPAATASATPTPTATASPTPTATPTPSPAQTTPPATETATASPTPTATEAGPDLAAWFEKTENYDGVVDKTGKSSVTVEVGPADVAGGPFAFEPATIAVSPGTTVTWVWTGRGGSHNVVHTDGAFESELTSEPGFEFSYPFDSRGTYRYVCRPHEPLGMVGAVVVE